MKVLFLTSPDFHVEICLKVKRALENILPELETKFIENPLWRINRIGYFENMFDKKSIDLVENTLNEFRPDIIVATDDGPSLFGTFTKVARLKNIPVLVIQDGLKSKKTEFTFKLEIVFDVLKWKRFFLWHILSRITQLKIIARVSLFLGWRTRVLQWGLGGADLYAVSGFFTKRLLSSRGLSSNKIAVTGFPLLDDLKSMNQSQKNGVRRRLNLKNHGDVILFLSQPFVNNRMWAKVNRNRFLCSLLKATKQLGATLIIKLHPREEPDKYNEIMRMNSNVIVVKDYDLHELTQTSNCVVTINSTAGLWALVYGKPLITYQDRSMSEESFYKNVGIEINDPDDLSQILKNLLKDQEMQQKLLKETKEKLVYYLHLLDGKATVRIANLILRLTNKDAAHYLKTLHSHAQVAR